MKGVASDFLGQNHSIKLNLLLFLFCICWVIYKITHSTKKVDCGAKPFGKSSVANQNYCSKVLKIINNSLNEKPFSYLYGGTSGMFSLFRCQFNEICVVILEHWNLLIFFYCLVICEIIFIFQKFSKKYSFQVRFIMFLIYFKTQTVYPFKVFHKCFTIK